MFLKRTVHAATQSGVDSLDAAIAGHRAPARDVSAGDLVFLARAGACAPAPVRAAR